MFTMAYWRSVQLTSGLQNSLDIFTLSKVLASLDAMEQILSKLVAYLASS